MKHKLIISVFTLMIFPLIASAQISSGGSFGLEKSVIAGGGGESAGGGFAIVGTSGQTAAGRITTQNPNFLLNGGFWAASPLAPTSASVSIDGKVLTLNGNGIRNVIVTLTDSAGSVRTTVTGSFGFYRFTDIEVGQIYVLKVQAKKYSFADPVRVLVVNDELTGIDFTADD